MRQLLLFIAALVAAAPVPASPAEDLNAKVLAYVRAWDEGLPRDRATARIAWAPVPGSRFVVAYALVNMAAAAAAATCWSGA